jgi:hypothetical protein
MKKSNITLVPANCFLLILFLFCFGQNYAQKATNVVIFDGSQARWKINVSVSPMFTLISSNRFEKEEKGRFGYNSGLYTTYFFKSFERLRLGLSLGINYNLYNTSRSLSIVDSAWSIDADGDQVHIFEQGTITEEQMVKDISMPIQLQMNYGLSERWDFYMHVGYSISLISFGSYTSNATLSRQGYYPAFNVLFYDINNAKYFFPNNMKMSDTKPLKLNRNQVVLGGFGLKYKLQPTKFSFYAGVHAIKGITNISNHSNTSGYIVVNNDKSHNSLMARGDKISTLAFGVQFGAVYDLDGGKIRYKRSVKWLNED